MASLALSPDLPLSIPRQDLEELQDLCRTWGDVSGALRLLAELQALPGLVEGSTDLATVQRHLDTTFRDLPCLMRVIADAVDARSQAGIRLVDLAREHAHPRFRLKPGRALAEVPAAFLNLGDPPLRQSALREAHAQGQLPECLERASA